MIFSQNFHQGGTTIVKYEATPTDNSFHRARESEKVSNDHLTVVLVSKKVQKVAVVLLDSYTC